MDSLRVERWQKDRDTFKSRAEKLGAEVIVQSADGDARKQNDRVVIAKDGVAAAQIVESVHKRRHQSSSL